MAHPEPGVGDTVASFVHERGDRLRAVIASARALGPAAAAVVMPVDPLSLQGVAAAAECGLITPVLIGPKGPITTAADEAGVDISRWRIEPAADAYAAALRAAALIRAGEAAMVMKGALRTEVLMRAVVDRTAGLRTAGRMSHVYVMDVPAYTKLLLVTDAALNIAPDLACKADIVRNSVAVAAALGVHAPKVAVLAAVETVQPAMPATIDAAALCKMAERGQISGAIVDGPLAFDNAVSFRAAAVKHIRSPVAGDADIVIAPDIEAGNMLAKQLDYLAGAVAAGVVAGARAPIVLTSRAEDALPRMAACATARLMAAQEAA